MKVPKIGVKTDLKEVLQIVANHDHYFVVNKVPGMVCQPMIKTHSHLVAQVSQRGIIHEKPYVLDVLKSQLSSLYNPEEQHQDDLKMVHRIDGPVTGGVLITKTPNAAKNFSKYLKVRGNSGWTFNRRYLGILSKEIENFNHREKGVIDVLEWKTNKPAFTKYKRVKDNLYVFELFTGRKHQIRTGCEYTLRAPILYDTKYNKSHVTFKSLLNNEPAIALHSALITTVIGQQPKNEHLVPVPPHVLPMWSQYCNEKGEFHSDITEALLENWDDWEVTSKNLKRL